MSGQQLILGDSLTLLPDLCPNPAVIVTDPPYGNAAGYLTSDPLNTGRRSRPIGQRHRIAGDHDTTTRDRVLAHYPNTPTLAFGSLHRAPPPGTVQTLVYRKAPGGGAIAARAGWRRDLEAIHLIGPWPQGAALRSSLLTTAARAQVGPYGIPGRHGHPHAKPLDVLCALLDTCPPGLVLDPFAGSGTTLLACRLLGRPAIGIEIDPRWFETAQANLNQQVLA